MKSRFEPLLLSFLLVISVFTPNISHALPFFSPFHNATTQNETQQSFIRALSDAFALISNPEISENVKKEQIDALFGMVDTYCQGHCEFPLKALETFNGLAGSKPVSFILEKLKDTRFAKHAEKADTIRKNIQVAHNALAGQDAEVFRYRIRAAVELARYIISLREKAYFQALSSGDARIRNTQAAIQDDMLELKRYIKAMQEIGLVAADVFERMKGAGEAIKAVKNSKQGNGEDDPKLAEARAQEAFAAVELTENEARRIADAISSLNLIVFNKAIQSLSNNSLLLGVGTRKFFKKFQDHMPQTPPEVIVRTIREDLGRDPSEIFIDFDPTKPIASATIGQTYRAKIRTLWGGTREVIVKVQKPDLAADLEASRKVDTLLMKSLKVFQGSESRESIFGLIGA